MSTQRNSQTRIFRTGGTLVTETPELRGLSVEQIRTLLKPTFPEIAHATVRERLEGDTLVVEFLPVAGRKG